MNTATSNLFAALDMVVLLRDDHGSFRMMGSPPAWFSDFCEACSLSGAAFVPSQMSAFLESFLEEAGEVFSGDQKPTDKRQSGWWTRVDQDGTQHYFQATAVRLGRKGLLVIRHEAENSDLFLALRKYKEGALLFDQTQRQKDRCDVDLRKLTELSMTDELTGLPNERGFARLAPEKVEAAKRARLPLLVFAVGVGDIARINERYGQTEGSMALLAATRILQSTFGEPGLVSRFAGAEFVALIPETAYQTEKVLTEALSANLASYNKKSFKTYDLLLFFGTARVAPELAGDLSETTVQALARMRDNRKKEKK
ncbi:MAG: GGDEF domain-containing protein [Thermodesulfobacteriota bacterium]